jgi:hypothetical protein
MMVGKLELPEGAEIRLTVAKDGTPTVSVAGISGPSCKAVTKSLERRLGVAKRTQHTREMKEAQSGHRNRARR